MTGNDTLFYVDELCRCLALSREQRNVFALYAVGMAADFLDQFAASETPAWNRRMVTAFTGWLAAAVAG